MMLPRSCLLTTPMLVLGAGIWLYTNLGTEWVTTRIARDRIAIWLVAAPLFAYMAYSHLYRLWFDLPVWYNLTVVVIFPAARAPGQQAGRPPLSRATESNGGRTTSRFGNSALEWQTSEWTTLHE